MKRHVTFETFIYIVVWALLFVVPVLFEAWQFYVVGSDHYAWSQVYSFWGRLSPYLLIFVLHNWVLMPLLVEHRRRALYIVLLTVVVAGFALYQFNVHPGRPMDRRGPDGHPPVMMHEDREAPPPFDMDEPFYKAGERTKEHRPPVWEGMPELMAVVMLVLMLGMNCGVKLYLRQRSNDKRMDELERKNLQQQLEYLRYQINPHFFMNTLNNIHALVDIDPVQAKQTIVELSKLMRFVLYEGARERVPLEREIDFIQHYITLMRLRYTDNVRITFSLPPQLPECELPPLLLITFVENAFKHGVSYQHESFIDISLDVCQCRLRFECSNSKKPVSEGGPGGVGLANARKRLDLTYGTSYTLDIRDEASAYHVLLEIPI